MSFFVLFSFGTIVTLNLFFMNSMASSLETLWRKGTFVLAILLRFILKPGLFKVTAASNPIIPISALYSTPGISIYSGTPNEKLPNLSNFDSVKALFAAASNLFNTFSAISPRKVTFVAISNLGLTPHVGILFMVLVFTGLALVIIFNNIEAFSSLSPVLPTPMLSVTFSIFTSCIGFIFLGIYVQCQIRISL